MLIVKLIVLFVYIISFSVICFDNYCEICANHTLCLYSSPGPSTTCKSYEVNALLTKHEIDRIVNSINERRNFIAMGLSSFVPQAANMKKIVWSPDLATSAQRWVDQCDSTIRPDKEDQCRNLAHTKVGQNIATIFGPTPGLHIKSFVELWFIPILKYRGSVSYYNQSKDHGTDYFTQLIWAETEFVGCGKARFYIIPINMIVERLVCNFAPKGNIIGKTIYAVGYPSTQCPNYMTPDEVFRGLCKNKHSKNIIQQKDKRVRKLATSLPPVTSLLRILNLSNNPMKQEIDPLRSYLKQIHYNSNKTNERKNQKIRHVFFNNTYGGVKWTPSLKSRNFWNMATNNSDKHNNPVEKGHSRVYHGYESHLHNHESHTHSYNSYDPTQKHNNEGFRKYDFISDTIRTYTGKEFQKYIIDPQCTRKQHTAETNWIPKNCPTDICTRGEKYNDISESTISCPPTVCDQVTCSNINEKSSQCNDFHCIKQSTTYSPSPKQCTCNVNCHCMHTQYPLSCQNMRPSDSPAGLSYNFPPKIVLRNGNLKSTPENSSPVPWFLSSNVNHKSFKSSNKRRYHDENHRQVKDITGYPKLHFYEHLYSDNDFDSSDRKRRELERQVTFKPFWQMDELNYKKPELKSIRYTTIGIRKSRKSKRPMYTKNTESITISVIKLSPNNSYRNHVTEKYLSFEELMHLRKITATDRDLDPRRRVGDDKMLRQETTAVTTSTSRTTSEYTTNTPFIRKKHCTRKLTCTWTVFAITGADGNTINPGGGDGSFDRGSRTPLGYVEGCSRTSTCTREFMDRNQMASIREDESSSTSYGSTSEDEDYCERRSLDVRKRDLIQESMINNNNTYQEPYVHSSISSNAELPKFCFCNDDILRTKRKKKMLDTD